MSDPEHLAAPLDTATLAALDPSELDLRPRPQPAALTFLLTRRSTPAKTLTEPGPDAATLELLLRAATRSPDHGKLEPWRFVRIAGPAQGRVADVAARRARALGMDDAAAEKAAAAFGYGPLIVAVIAAPKPSDKIPETEQHASAAVVCAALVNAALAAGYGANWLTGWMATDHGFCETALGLHAHESVAGFVHIGTPKVTPQERPRPDVSDLLSDAPG